MAKKKTAKKKAVKKIPKKTKKKPTKKKSVKKSAKKPAKKAVKKKPAKTYNVPLPSLMKKEDRSKQKALGICSLIFALIALAHLLRILTGASLALDGLFMPIWGSAVIVIIAVWLAIWTYKLSKT